MTTTIAKSLNKSHAINKSDYLDSLECENNPILIRDTKNAATFAAFNLLKKVISDLDPDKISIEEKDALLKLIREVYLERKMQSYLNVRSNAISGAINYLMEFAVNKHNEEDSKFYYYNSLSHHCIKNG